MARGSGFRARMFTLAAMRNPDSTRTVHTKTWTRLRLKRFRSSMRAPRQNPVTPLPMSAVSTTSKAIVANQARSIDSSGTSSATAGRVISSRSRSKPYHPLNFGEWVMARLVLR